MSEENDKIECEQAIKLILNYLDNELDTHDHDVLETHLHTCRSCYSRMEFEKRLKNTIADQQDEEASGKLRNRVNKIFEQF